MDEPTRPSDEVDTADTTPFVPQRRPESDPTVSEPTLALLVTVRAVVEALARVELPVTVRVPVAVILDAVKFPLR